MAWMLAICENCQGSGIKNSDDDFVELKPCPTCKGYGAKPTKAISLNVVKRFRTEAAAWRWVEKNNPWSISKKEN